MTTMVQNFTRMQAWLHDTFIANRALRLHDHILDSTGLAEVLDEPVERRLLDVGCGGGQAVIMLQARYPHLRLAGIDLSDFMVERAQRNADKVGYAIQFEVADAQSLPYSDASFDVVYSFGSAKHWPEPIEGFSECWRVLKPGGHMLIADATSEVTSTQVQKFYSIAGFPDLLKKPVARLLQWRMFRPAKPMAFYHQIADDLGLPAGTVGQVPSMPAFLFSTRKPVGRQAV
jgi:ubiquinone/menaquinone biosynthesis C-methylase UbiE